MAIMNVKHGFVRTFGLAGKVVILDEVHSYDSFTGTILKVLVDAVRQLGCTVLILSATLTQERGTALLGMTPQKVVRYLHDRCSRERGSMIFRRIPEMPRYEIYGGTKRDLIEISGLQLVRKSFP